MCKKCELFKVFYTFWKISEYFASNNFLSYDICYVESYKTIKWNNEFYTKPYKFLWYDFYSWKLELPNILEIKAISMQSRKTGPLLIYHYFEYVPEFVDIGFWILEETSAVPV